MVAQVWGGGGGCAGLHYLMDVLLAHQSLTKRAMALLKELMATPSPARMCAFHSYGQKEFWLLGFGGYSNKLGGPPR